MITSQKNRFVNRTWRNAALMRARLVRPHSPGCVAAAFLPNGSRIAAKAAQHCVVDLTWGKGRCAICTRRGAQRGPRFALPVPVQDKVGVPLSESLSWHVESCEVTSHGCINKGGKSTCRILTSQKH